MCTDILSIDMDTRSFPCFLPCFKTAFLLVDEFAFAVLTAPTPKASTAYSTGDSSTSFRMLTPLHNELNRMLLLMEFFLYCLSALNLSSLDSLPTRNHSPSFSLRSASINRDEEAETTCPIYDEQIRGIYKDSSL